MDNNSLKLLNLARRFGYKEVTLSETHIRIGEITCNLSALITWGESLEDVYDILLEELVRERIAKEIQAGKNNG